ncbi:MAG: nitrous oxide reductase family maturation protein NosD [Candidatus Bathyarchaeia archaeon]
MKKPVVLLLVSLTLLSICSVAAVPVRANPRTIIVPVDYTRIQWAIGNATDGDTIQVRAGTYLENIAVDKSITLMGEGRNSIIDGGNAGTAVMIAKDRVTVTGFTIRNGNDSSSTGPLPQPAGIGIAARFCVVTGNTLTGNRIGILLYGPTANGNVIDGNSILSSNQGVWLASTFNNTITGNLISGSDYGIDHDQSYNNTVTVNTISNNVEGIYVYYAQDLIYHNNFLSNHAQVFYTGTNFTALDNGYPSGGNYWSNYNGVDTKSGPYQNITGSDGIGDTYYYVDNDDRRFDRYPLMSQVNVIPEFPSTFLLVLLVASSTALLAMVFRRRRLAVQR